MSKQLTNNARYWFNLANYWRQLGPPIRPSKMEIKNYEQFLPLAIKKRKKLKILILGATPELRDLAHKYQAEVTVVDINWQMIMAMRELMKYKNKPEIWVKSGWTAVPLADNYYDVILGDGVVGNISQNDSRQWWQHLNEFLKNGGYFITRIFVGLYDKKAVADEFRKLLSDIFKKNKLSLTEIGSVKVYLELLTINPKTREGTSSKYREIYHKYSKDFEISAQKKERIFKQVVKVYPASKKIWYTPDINDIKKEIQPYFKIIAIKNNPNKYFKETGQIYLFKNRSVY